MRISLWRNAVLSLTVSLIYVPVYAIAQVQTAKEKTAGSNSNRSSQNSPNEGNDAEDIAALLAGCTSMTDAKKKIKCFEAASSLASGKAASTKQELKIGAEEIERDNIQHLKEKFGRVTRAFSAIKAATEIGVAYNRYGEFVQDIATELALAKADPKTEDERAAILNFGLAMNAYNDASKFWIAHIEYFSKERNRNVISLALHGEAMPIPYTGMEWYVSTYQVPTQSVDIWGTPGATRSNGLNAAWRKADEYVRLANDLLFAPKSNRTTATNTTRSEKPSTTASPGEVGSMIDDMYRECTAPNKPAYCADGN